MKMLCDNRMCFLWISGLEWGLVLSNKKKMPKEVLSYLDAVITSLPSTNQIRVEFILYLFLNTATKKLSPLCNVSISTPLVEVSHPLHIFPSGKKCVNMANSFKTFWKDSTWCRITEISNL